MDYVKLKRLFDIILSIILIILLFPFFIFLIILNFLLLKKNPLFIQSRSGINGKSIKIIKIKTLNDNLNLDINARSYLFGKFLRKFKLDEFPQLINVLFGDMSIVGPRPLYLEYNKNYNNFQKQRLLVKPGITGLAQIKVLNSGNWKNKFKFDVWYVKNISFKLDIYIIFKTIILLINILLLKKRFIEDHKFKDVD